MTRAESILASRLLDQAAHEFHRHCCNDMNAKCFEDFTPEEIRELEVGYNAWKRGETGETCGAPEDEYTKLIHIGDAMWMSYLATVIGRGSK